MRKMKNNENNSKIAGIINDVLKNFPRRSALKLYSQVLNIPCVGKAVELQYRPFFPLDAPVHGHHG